MVAIAALSTIARLVNVPYPIILVIGGLAIGLLPGAPDIQLEPDLVLVIFLPPLLYAAAFFSSLHDLRAQIKPISALAIGLVIATTCVVAVVAHFAIDDFSWGAAFTLGAIVAPTDPIAAAAIARSQGAPRVIVTIVEGESLINDGTALVLFRAAVIAVVVGSFSIIGSGGELIYGAVGGVAVGLVTGWPIAEIRKRLHDPPVEITISLATAYAAYLPAEKLGLSGVLAAVTVGIYLGWRAPEVSTAEMRMQGRPVWELLQFLLNAFLFLLVGMQLPIVIEGLNSSGVPDLIGPAVLICFVVLAVRLIWTNALPLLGQITGIEILKGIGSWQRRLVIGWSGMRGAVSLAAALSIPLSTDAGTAFPQRNLIIFIAFSVILFTLIVQGLTLPHLMRRLDVRDDGVAEREEAFARIHATEVALERLGEIVEAQGIDGRTANRLQQALEARLLRYKNDGDDTYASPINHQPSDYVKTMDDLVTTQRNAVVALRNEGEISNEVMLRLEREFDLETSRLPT